MRTIVGRKKKNVKERELVGKGGKKNEKDGWKEDICILL